MFCLLNKFFSYFHFFSNNFYKIIIPRAKKIFTDFKNSMENKISFTGIRNIGSVQLQREGCKIAKNLSMVLSDDVNGKDAQEFCDVLTKCSNIEVKKDYNNILLNLETLHTTDGKRFLSVNGTILEEKDENLSMFSYLAKLTRRICNMPEKDMIVNNDYKNIAGRETLVQGVDIETYDELVKNGFVEQIFDKSWVKDASEKINKFIDDIMFSYLDIKNRF